MPNTPETKYEGVTVEYREKTSPVWDMSQERLFIETLLNQRFNFFLVFFSLVLAGAVNAKHQIEFQLILTLGAFVTTMFALVLNRSQQKLDLIISDLMTDPTHPVRIIDNLAGRSGGRRQLIGVWIPRFCATVLWVAAVAAWTFWRHAGPAV